MLVEARHLRQRRNERPREGGRAGALQLRGVNPTIELALLGFSDPSSLRLFQ
jgi:hypothetical protein